MSSNSNNIIRLNVGSPDNIQASTWRIWQEKDEIYILVREMKKWLKISLHNSGQCHIKSLANLEKNTAGDYYMHKWHIPELAKAKSITETFRITIPANCIQKPMNKSPLGEDMDEVSWIQTHKPEKVGILFITTKPDTGEDFVKKIYLAYSVIKKFALNNRNVYVLYTKEEASPVYINEIIKYTEKLNLNFSKKPEENEKYAVMLELYKKNVPEIVNTIPGENSIRYPH